jgi:hypothetical protein
MVGTNSADPETFVTDSAAAATSLATGVKTYNGAIGVDAEGRRVRKIVEQAKVDVILGGGEDRRYPAGNFPATPPRIRASTAAPPRATSSRGPGTSATRPASAGGQGSLKSGRYRPAPRNANDPRYPGETAPTLARLLGSKR